MNIVVFGAGFVVGGVVVGGAICGIALWQIGKAFGY
jgi:hypothetical protein